MRNIALLVALSFTLPGTTAAQDPLMPPLVTMATAQVKPDMTLEFEGLIQELRDANQEAGTPFFVAYEVLRGAASQYVTFVPISSFADLDAPSPAFQVMGEVGRTEWLARINKTTVSVQFDNLRTLGDLAIPLAEGRQPGLAVLSMRRNLPGMRGEYVTWIRDQQVPALREAGVNGVFQFQNAHSGRNWYQLRLVDNWASFDEPNPLQGTAVNPAGGRLSTASETKVMRILPELSILPAQP